MKKIIYWKLSAFFFVYFFSWLVFFAFLPIWFGQKIQLTGMQIGTIYAGNAIFSMVLQPFYGYLSDKIGMKRYLLFFIVILVALTGPFFVFVYEPLLINNFYVGAVIGSFVLSLAYYAGVAVIESFIEKCGRIYDFEFGRARAWGSLGAAVGVFCAGRAFNYDPDLIFWMASAGAIVLLLILLTVRIDESKVDFIKSEPINLTNVKHLFSLKDVWLFMIFILGSACVYGVFDQQFAIYYASLFPTVEQGNETFGYLNSLQIFLEAGGMCLAPFIVNKIGPKHGLILAGAIMTFRMIGSGLANDPISISIIKLLHAIELSILLVSVFKYLAKNFDTRLSSVLYLVGYQLSNQLGSAILSPIVGNLYDTVGFKVAYLFLGAVVGVFTVFGAFVLISDKRIPKEKQSELKEYIQNEG